MRWPNPGESLSGPSTDHCSRGRHDSRGRPGSRGGIAVLLAGLLLTACTGQVVAGTASMPPPDPGRRSADVRGDVPPVPPAPVSEPGRDTDAGIEAQAVLDVALDGTEPGCSAAFGEQGAVVWAGARGLADVAAGRPITTDSRFDIGSIGKQFTAAAVLLLAQDGRLSLDDALSDHLDGFPPWAHTVALRELMHHRSGVPGYIPILDARGLDHSDEVTQQTVLEALRQVQTLDFPPGKRFDYSDSNYVLLAAVAEAVGGQDLPDLLHARIAAPLGLDLVMDTGDQVPRRVTGYESAGGDPVAVVEHWSPYGDGGVQATPSDLVRWADNFRTGSVGGSELSAAQLTDLVPTGVNGSRYGAGVFVNADGTVGHPGTWLGFTAVFGISPDRRRAIAVTCNDDSIRAGTIMAELSRIWFPPT